MTINFDKDSVYEDRTGADGKFFDTYGNYKGYCDGSGRYFDGSGVFKGTRKADGKFYDTTGRCLGYTDGKHWCFDALGLFIESKPEGAAKEKPAEKKKEELKDEGANKGVGGKLKGILDKI